MVTVEMLNDEEIIEREHKLVFAEAAGVPQHDVLLFPFLYRGKLEISQDGILFGIFGSACRHRCPSGESGILTNRFPALQLPRSRPFRVVRGIPSLDGSARRARQWSE